MFKAKIMIVATLGLGLAGCDTNPEGLSEGVQVSGNEHDFDGIVDEVLAALQDDEGEPPTGEELEAEREAEWERTRFMRNEREEQGLPAVKIPDFMRVEMGPHQGSEFDATAWADAMIEQAEPGAIDRDELIAHLNDGDMQPRVSCSGSFTSINGRLCITTGVRNATTRRLAGARCMDYYGEDAHVCTHDEYNYLFQYSSYDASFNPYGMWIGGYADDSTSYCGNRSVISNGHPNIDDFDGECGVHDTRPYRCCELW